MQNEIILHRFKWLEEHFYIHADVLVDFNNYKIIKRKQFIGIINVNRNVVQEILPTIFDDVTMIYRDLAKVRLLNKWGVYDVEKTSWIVDLCCEQMEVNEFYNTIELIAAGKHGLLDIKEKNLLIPIQYEDVTIDAGCEYLWVKKKSHYHFVKKSTGKFLSMIDAVMAYDTSIGLFVKSADGIVHCVNELGLDDPILFRSLVIRNHGRLKLQNTKLHECDIIDIYGFVLN